jgi:hypothetical protein
MKLFCLALLLPCLATLAQAQAQQPIWRCDQNGRPVYQQQPCEGREVGKRDRRTLAQKRAEREAAKREKEKEKEHEQAEAAAAPASDAASASAAAASVPSTAVAGTPPASGPARATLGAPKKKKS